ncbi:MAG: hypothetical protein LUC83_02315 [Clostridiales bacterium]|nr:hypothetical protein [Clostridiales bacterium]
MNPTEEKIIQKKKKSGYNIYGVNDKLFYILAALICGLAVAALLQLMISEFPMPVRAGLSAAILAVAVVIALVMGRSDQGETQAYRREEGFEFIGLYDLSSDENLEGRDVLSRSEEVSYLNQKLENLIFRQNGVKQAICLTGKSGCGKSTILSFFKKQYQDVYQIYDLTGNYTQMKAALVDIFGTKIDQGLMVKAQEKRIVFILDQFERYFFLEDEKREQVRALMLMMNRKNTAMILSMREEYLADFMKEFDVNNMKEDGRAAQVEEKTGILNNLTSIIRDDRKNYHIRKEKDRMKMYTWRDESVRQSHFIHLEHVGGYAQSTSLDPVGNTIFYCENQNDVHVRLNGTEEEATVLQSKCERLFDQDGSAFYRKHRQEPLIQQQISYHMAEYEKKVKKCSIDELRELFEMEDYELLNHYFDIQLTATGDYYNASRIMYLLSSVRMNHVVMKRQDLENGLFAGQFSKDGHIAVGAAIDKLEELQLIRSSIEHSDQLYEIAHDFIAQTFLTYSHSNMDRNVKGALDIYIAEYLDANKADYIEEKQEHNRKVQKSRFYPVVYGIFAILVLVLDGIIHFVFNPWTGPWEQINAYGDIFTFVPVITTELSMLYIFHMYHKVMQFYRGRRENLCKALFVLVMALSAVAVFFYPHGMFFYGAGLTIVGLNAAFLLNDSDQKASRQEMRNYGLKCALIAVAYAVLHFVLLLFNQVFPVYLILVEMVMMYLLIAYAYLAHLTREHLYGRRMDVSSDREL